MKAIPLHPNLSTTDSVAAAMETLDTTLRFLDGIADTAPHEVMFYDFKLRQMPDVSRLRTKARLKLSTTELCGKFGRRSI